MENNRKSILLEIEDARYEIVDVVNKAVRDRGIPCYLLEPIIADIYGQIKAGANAEIERERQAMAEVQKD